MKNIYKLVFALNNTDKDENFILNLEEIDSDEIALKKALDRLVFSPRQKVVDNIFKFVRNSKI